MAPYHLLRREGLAGLEGGLPWARQSLVIVGLAVPTAVMMPKADRDDAADQDPDGLDVLEHPDLPERPHDAEIKMM